jgi:E3 ubiquitin-protein ligase HECTD2
MAPWTSRSHLARSRDDIRPVEPPRDAAFLSPSRLQSPPRVTEADILQHAYGIPSLRELNSQTSNQGSSHGRSTSRHGRSMSHPFPSIFQSKKKNGADNGAPALDSADVDHSRLIPQSPSKTTTSKFGRVPDKDLVTGKCMTCDSMVRWPKELAVFRCTVCLTINDLKSTVDVATGGMDKAHASTSGKQSTHLISYPKSR